MGWVWNIVLSFSNEEFWVDGEDEPRETCESLERINTWISDGRLVKLTGPTFDDGTGCGMDANLYGGGFKHFNIEGFIETVNAQEWKSRGAVQLWVKGAEEGMGEEPFTSIKIGPRKRKATPSRGTPATAKSGPRSKQNNEARKHPSASTRKSKSRRK